MKAVQDFFGDLLRLVKADPVHYGVVAAVFLVVGVVVGKLA